MWPSASKPDEAARWAARGVTVRRGDYDDPETLYQSFAGADRLLLVSASGIDHEKRDARHRNAIEAAVRAGVGHVYYTSLLPGAGSAAYVMKAHLDTDTRDLKASGLPFTILRNGAYAEAWELYLGDVSGGEAVIPADGPVSWVSRTDLAEGAARLLNEGGRAGETLNLTGPAAYDVQATAEILSRLQGRPIIRRIVPVNEYVARLKAAGKSEELPATGRPPISAWCAVSSGRSIRSWRPCSAGRSGRLRRRRRPELRGN